MAKENAKYFVGNPVQSDGKVPHSLTVKDVPVDAFWSITVYVEMARDRRVHTAIGSINASVQDAS